MGEASDAAASVDVDSNVMLGCEVGRGAVIEGWRADVRQSHPVTSANMVVGCITRETGDPKLRDEARGASGITLSVCKMVAVRINTAYELRIVRRPYVFVSVYDGLCPHTTPMS